MPVGEGAGRAVCADGRHGHDGVGALGDGLNAPTLAGASGTGERPKLSAAEFVEAANLVGPCHFTQGMLSALMRVRLVGDGSCVPVAVAGTVVTGAAAVVVGDTD